LVLAVVIILPMLLDGEPNPVPSGINITIPSKSQPLEPLTTAPIQTPIVANTDSQTSLTTTTETDSTPVQTEIATPVSPSTVERPVAIAPVAPTTPPVTREAPATTPPVTAEPRRTDDGSRALALLAGRTPTAPAAESGQFVVQVASYSTHNDANTRLDKLRSEGVSNAFVEQGAIEGKNVFRLRVGPFVSRDAAQAAQTRLRTLGYNTGFITTQ
jgi:DedD protein